jgi:hypothetical protein
VTVFASRTLADDIFIPTYFSTGSSLLFFSAVLAKDPDSLVRDLDAFTRGGEVGEHRNLPS